MSMPIRARVSTRLEHRDLQFRSSRSGVLPSTTALYWAEKIPPRWPASMRSPSMLYLDYSRKEGEWIPNEYGGRENLESICFLQKMNTLDLWQPSRRHDHCGRILWPKVSQPVHEGGLGWLQVEHGLHARHAELFAREPRARKFHHQELSFRPALRLHRKFRAADLA